MHRHTFALLAAALAATAVASPVHAGEADDLQRMIDSARQNAVDLERLDEQRAVREDLTVMRMWLDEAWKLRTQQKYDAVRIVWDRIDAQAAMIRHRITASQLMAQAAKKEAEVQAIRDEIDRTKKAIEEARTERARLEARSK